jgi:hypothetical protein
MRTPLSIAFAAVFALHAGTAAATPTLTVDKPCYTSGEDITFNGGGYTPSGNVGFLFSLKGPKGSNILGFRPPAVADTAGGIHYVARAPDLASSDDTEEDLFATANDETRLAPPNVPDANSFGAAQAKLSVWDVSADPWDSGLAAPLKRMKIRAFGFEPAKRLWAHYVLHGKVVKTVALGALQGPCGDLTKTIRQFPFRPVPAGTYQVYFEGQKVFDKHGAWIRYRKVKVTTPIP